MEDYLIRHQVLLQLLAKNETGTLDEKEFTETVAPIYNRTVVSLELLTYYLQLWSQQFQGPAPLIEQLKFENGERIKEILKFAFVATMSHIEFRCRQIINDLPEHPLKETINRKERLYDEFIQLFNNLDKPVQDTLRQFKNKLKDTPPFDSFSRIVENSAKCNLINQEEFQIWDFAVKVRNVVVHNNSIAAQNCSITVDGIQLEMTKDQMMQGRLDFFLILMEQMSEILINWHARIKPKAVETN